MSSLRKSSNSSGKCIYCNTFFRRLASHMLLSESCMLASQESSSHKALSRDDYCDNLARKNDSTYDDPESCRKKRSLYFEHDLKGNTQQLPLKNQRTSQCNATFKEGLSIDNSSHSSANSNFGDGYNMQSDSSQDDIPSCDNSSIISDVSSIRTLPLEGDFFHRAFTPEEHFMINLCNTCVDANVPLDLVDKIVAIIRDAQNNGLNIDSNIVRSREFFLKHLNKRFAIPLPETVKVRIEDPSGNNINIDLIRHNFLQQAMDLIHDHEIWGDQDNFVRTIDMNNPFDPLKYGRCDNKVDEVVDGLWYKETVRECAKIAKGEHFLVLGLICYCDKTGTDVNQRNSLEPFSFTFCVFN